MCATSGRPSLDGREDGDRQPAVDRRQPEADRRQQPARLQAPRGTGRATIGLTQLPVGEHPVVEVHAPTGDVRLADQEVHLGQRPAERVAVERDPAVARPGALDVGQPVVLGDRSVGRCERLLDERDVEVAIDHGRQGRCRPAPARLALPGVLADPRGADLADQQARGREPVPAHVFAVADAADDDLPGPAIVDGAIETEVEARGLPRGQGPVARGRLEVGVGRPEPRGVGRPAAQRQLVDQRDGAEQGARRQDHGDRDQPAREQPAPAERAATKPTAGDPEPREHRRREQRDHPRIGRLERRQERLRPAADELRDDARDRGDQQQDGREPQPRGGRERPVAPRDRRPAHRHERDQDRPDGGQADDEVDGSARAVADEHQAEHHEPQDHEDHGQDPQLDRPHAHGRSLPMHAGCAASTGPTGLTGHRARGRSNPIVNALHRHAVPATEHSTGATVPPSSRRVRFLSAEATPYLPRSKCCNGGSEPPRQ